jgi:phospholipase C
LGDESRACANQFGRRRNDGSPRADLSKIETIVVIYAENRSFDHLYGLFPGANGLADAKQTLQRDHDGSELPYLTVWDSHGKPHPNYPRLPNAPFRIDAEPVNKGADQVLLSPIHAYYHNIEQINGGRNDMFAAMSTVGGYTMGYFDGSRMKLWQWAKEYTLADNFFMGAFGGSFLNHQWLVCACTPVFRDAPESMLAKLDANGKLAKKPDSPSARDGAVQTYTGGLGGQITPDGFAVNTTQPAFQPSGIPPAAEGSLDLADPKGTERLGSPLPPQTNKTIGDTLSAKGITWAWYAGGWNAALADGRRSPAEKRAIIYTRENGSLNFQPHHQPFNYFQRFAPATPDRERHLKDGILVGIGFWFPAVLGALATLAVLSAFRVIESRLPSEFYAHHHLRFKREAVMPEDRLRELVGAHGFTIANLSSRLVNEGKIFEYRMVIRSRHRANAQKLAQHLLGLDEVIEFRISPTGD